MAEQPELRSLKEGDAFAGFLLAQEVAFKTSAKGSEYLEMKLADASGDLKAFLWDLRAIEGDMEKVAADAFLRVKGQISNYNGRTQLRLDKLRYAEDHEIGDFSRFFPTSQRPLEAMILELDAAVAGVGDPWIRRLLELLFVRILCCARPSARPRPPRASTTCTWVDCWSTPSRFWTWLKRPVPTTAR